MILLVFKRWGTSSSLLPVSSVRKGICVEGKAVMAGLD